MSGGRVSIPNNVRKTIQNIKEITGNHSEDEIYAMLRECSMDPNETAQKLLFQDPFHEVRRKRDRKKENVIKESMEPKWKPGMQGRGNRGGRGNYSSRHNSHDAGGRKNVVSGKENEMNKGTDDGVIPPAFQDKKNKETYVVESSSKVAPDNIPVIVAEKTNVSASKTPSSSPGVNLSTSDPILMPSQDSRIPVGTIKREVGSQRIPVDQVQETPVEIKTLPGTEGNNLVSESPRSTHVSSSISRPPSNYNNRPQQAIGPQKVGPVKEWKVKPTISIPAVECDSNEVAVEGNSSLKTESSITESKESHIPEGQHVIIPNHLHVPEAEKLGFRFGSFDFSSTSLSDPMIEKSPPVSEGINEQQIDENAPRSEDVLVTADNEEHPERPLSSSNVAENISAEVEVEAEVEVSINESKQETLVPTTGHQYPVVHPSSNLNLGFMPPIIGSHLAPSETIDSQLRDSSRLPSFVVQQPFDPAGYYPQFYRSGGDGDGRVSPFHPAAVATKYNGNVALLSQQASASQSSQEVGNSIMMSGTGPTAIAVSQQVMQNSIAVTQQPLPVFRQPAGIHFPPNYIPYGPYFSPYYLPPPAIHQFLTNGGFPQQPPAGTMYPPQQVATPKYPLSQYKPGNPGHIGVHGSYGPYGSGYNPNPAVTAGNSANNDDLGGSQFKESNVYVTGQQSEGPGVWIATGGRDISGSFYNIPQATFASIYHPQQPVTTGPIIHPLLQQAQPVDMVGPTSTVYQQAQPPPQPPQINWPNNY